MNLELPMCLLDWINPNNINYRLCDNPSEGAMQLLEKNPDIIDWKYLSISTSKCAIQLLEKNPDKIDWWYLSENTSEGAIRLKKIQTK